jgi:hypothetical protein
MRQAVEDLANHQGIKVSRLCRLAFHEYVQKNTRKGGKIKEVVW